MKKTFGLYIAGWLAVLGLFNVITFVTPNEINGVSKFDTLFWLSYAFITLFFIGQLACAYFVFRADTLQKIFYNISLLKVSIVALVAILVTGGLCMSVIQIPDWIGIIVCSIVLAVNVVVVIKAVTAISAVNEIDQTIKSKTLFIKLLTAEAQSLMERTSDEQMQKLAKNVYEAIRYSDPMSNHPALDVVENTILDTFRNFAVAVDTNSVVDAQTFYKTLLALISDRNARCKSLK